MIEIEEFIILNKNEIKEDIRKNLQALLMKEKYFVWPFSLAYNVALRAAIMKELENVCLQHFPTLTIEDIMCILTEESVRNLTGDYFFDFS